VRYTEHWTLGPQGRAGFEGSGIHGIEAESIDQLQYRGDRGAVIARSGDGDSARSSTRTPALLELEDTERGRIRPNLSSNQRCVRGATPVSPSAHATAAG